MKPVLAGIIGNPRSHLYRSDPAALETLVAGHAGVMVAQPDGQAALLEALRRFQLGGVSLLVVHGGDGTLRHVLSALPLCYPDGSPRIALIRAGNTNLAAWSLGGIGAGPAALGRLLAAEAAGRLRQRACPVLEVSWLGEAARPKLRGLFFGAAGFAEGKRLADSQIHRRGLFLRQAVGFTLGLTFVRSLSRHGALREGVPMSAGVDQGALLPGRRFLYLATTLDRLTLGLWPFWGSGEGGIRWLDIDSPPSRLARALLATLLRRPSRWMERHGYRSGRASSILLPELKEFVLDGEFFDGGAAGIALTCSCTVNFVRP